MSRRITAQMADMIWDKLNEQTDEALRSITEDCWGFTTTNCGWVEYELREVVADIVEELLRDREKEREELTDESVN